MSKKEEQIFDRALGARIADARRRCGLTQDRFGLLLGQSRSWVCHIEAGRNGVSVYDLVRIARETGVTVEGLVGETGGRVNPLP